MHGYDGKREQGSAVDVLDPVFRTWSTIKCELDGVHRLEPRSVSVLVAVKIKGMACW